MKFFREHWRQIAAVIPLLLVNAVAFTGQLIYWRSHLAWPLVAVIMFALALESIAVYLAYHAHLAVLSDDSAFRLRLGSYGFGAVIGLLNASHFLNNGRITAAAIGMGLMSASSPWLWGIHSRRQSRDILKTKGLIDGHAVRLGMTRWFWHPFRSSIVMWLATWTGETKPDAAIMQYEERVSARLALAADRKTEEESNEIDPKASMAANMRIALRVNPPDASASDIAAWLAERGVSVTSSYVRQIKSNTARKDIAAQRKAIHALPSGDTRQITN